MQQNDQFPGQLSSGTYANKIFHERMCTILAVFLALLLSIFQNFLPTVFSVEQYVYVYTYTCS